MLNIGSPLPTDRNSSPDVPPDRRHSSKCTKFVLKAISKIRKTDREYEKMKSQIPAEKKEEIEGSILRTVRVWLIFALVLYIPVQVFNFFRKEDPVPTLDQASHWVLILMLLLMLMHSCIGSLKSIKVGIIILQVRAYYALFQRQGIINTSAEKGQILMYTVCIIQVCFTNQVILCQLFRNHYNKLNAAMFFILYVGFFYRMIGLEALVSKIDLITIMTIIGLVLGLVV